MKHNDPISLKNGDIIVYTYKGGENKLLPQAVGQASATVRLEAHRKAGT